MSLVELKQTMMRFGAYYQVKGTEDEVKAHVQAVGVADYVKLSGARLPAYQEWGIVTESGDVADFRQARTARETYLAQAVPEYEKKMKQKIRRLVNATPLPKLFEKLTALKTEYQANYPEDPNWLKFLEEKFPYVPVLIRPLWMDEQTWQESQDRAQQYQPDMFETKLDGTKQPRTFPFRYTP